MGEKAITEKKRRMRWIDGKEVCPSIRRDDCGTMVADPFFLRSLLVVCSVLFILYSILTLFHFASCRAGLNLLSGKPRKNMNHSFTSLGSTQVSVYPPICFLIGLLTLLDTPGNGFLFVI